jgi:hypothetical protein
MSRRHHIVALAALVAFSSAGAIAAGQQTRDRVGDQQRDDLLRRMDVSVVAFRTSFDRAINRGRISGNRADIKQSVDDFQEATERVRAGRRNRRVGATTDVEDVLRHASSIDAFMTSNTLDTTVERDWLGLRGNLDELARTYDIQGDWSRSRNAAGDQDSGRLTGTYRLDNSRGDDSAKAVQQATRDLPPRQRKAVHQRLTNRLNSPESIVIDRNRNSVTMASSRGRKVTFEADGERREEQGPAGRIVTTRAALNGDQLLMTTTGERGNESALTLEAIDNGSQLRVTRRIEDDSLRQPLTVVSFYRKTSAEAEWDVESVNRRGRSRADSSADDIGVPDGTRLIGTLDNALNTRTANAEDRFTITTRSPSKYEGAVIQGTVSSVNASGRLSGRAEMALNLERIRLRTGQTYEFAGIIENVRATNGDAIGVNSEGAVADGSQTGKTVQRGGIGAALGAIIGAMSGGGQGAAIGAAIGAGGGAGTVLVEGRDQLDLARGTEFTITSTRQEDVQESPVRQR